MTPDDTELLREALEKTSWENNMHDEQMLHESRRVIPTDVYEDRIRKAARQHLAIMPLLRQIKDKAKNSPDGDKVLMFWWRLELENLCHKIADILKD